MSPLLILDKARRNGWALREIAKATGVHAATLRKITKASSFYAPPPETVAAIVAFAPAAKRPPERPEGWTGPSR